MSENMDLKTFFKKYMINILFAVSILTIIATDDTRWLYATVVLFAIDSIRIVREDLRKHAYTTVKGIVLMRILTVSFFFMMSYMVNDGLFFGMTADELDQKYPYLLNGLSLLWGTIIMESILKMKRFRTNG